MAANLKKNLSEFMEDALESVLTTEAQILMLENPGRTVETLSGPLRHSVESIKNHPSYQSAINRWKEKNLLNALHTGTEDQPLDIAELEPVGLNGGTIVWRFDDDSGDENSPCRQESNQSDESDEGHIRLDNNHDGPLSLDAFGDAPAGSDSQHLIRQLLSGDTALQLAALSTMESFDKRYNV
jgi:hypothetical protein